MKLHTLRLAGLVLGISVLAPAGCYFDRFDADLKGDGDGDGFEVPFDCNDENAAIRPGAIEVCDDGVDNDCDGAIDDGDKECSDQTTSSSGSSGSSSSSGSGGGSSSSSSSGAGGNSSGSGGAGGAGGSGGN